MFISIDFLFSLKYFFKVGWIFGEIFYIDFQGLDLRLVVLNICSSIKVFFPFDDLAWETETGREDETRPVQRPVSGLGGKAEAIFQNCQRL